VCGENTTGTNWNEPKRTGKSGKNFLGAVARAKISAKPKIPGEFARRYVVHDTILDTKLL
jgi:hypothetical protein